MSRISFFSLFINKAAPLLSVSVIFFLLLFQFIYVEAQQLTGTNIDDSLLEDELEFISIPLAGVPSGATSCFNYYKFNSVQVSVGLDTKNVFSGTTATFTGDIQNENNYPIIKGSLFVKIYKKESDSSLVQLHAHNLVDSFFVLENITLDAKEKRPISFTWKVPAYAMSGEYRVATFFVVDKKFNLLGLSFTDDILGNTFDFNVVGETAGGVYFDKNDVFVDGVKHRFASFIPKLEKDKPVVIKASLINSTKEKQTLSVAWKVCAWDGLRDESCKIYKTEDVDALPGVKTPISFTVNENTNPVYYVEAQAIRKDSKSIIGVRFARDGVDKTRLNFPGLSSFPLKKDSANVIFSCLHGMGSSPIVPGGRLELLLSDSLGKAITSHVYTGGVTGEMMAAAKEFVPTRDYDKVTLTAKLYQDEKLVDESSLTYDCSVINPGTCTIENNHYIKILLILIGGVISIGFIIFTIKRLRKDKPYMKSL